MSRLTSLPAYFAILALGLTLAGCSADERQQASASSQGQTPTTSSSQDAVESRAPAGTTESDDQAVAVTDEAPVSSAAAVPADDLPEISVYKTPNCGCCSKWVDHLEENGFTVATYDMHNVTPRKDRLGVPQQLRSCHTATVGGYVVEGHVPADEIKRMLTDEPAISGLAVPGMPVGSPGMEIEGRPAESYIVAAFGPDGSHVYARR